MLVSFRLSAERFADWQGEVSIRGAGRRIKGASGKGEAVFYVEKREDIQDNQ